MRHLFLTPLITALLLLPSAHAQSDRQAIAQAHWLNSDQAHPVTPSDTLLLKAVPNLKKTKGGYQDMCDTPVTPKILSLDVSGSLGRVNVVIEEDSACFGGAGADYTILDKDRHVLWQNSAAGIATLSSRHDGVQDLTFAGPGMSVPIWSWNAGKHSFVFRKTVETQ
ncbi:hypothetical protein A0U94_05940 [Gluconobacter albidus]|nr:hypothetical protein A0U94_05940 [Gluconobacter albidus]